MQATSHTCDGDAEMEGTGIWQEISSTHVKHRIKSHAPIHAPSAGSALTHQ